MTATLVARQSSDFFAFAVPDDSERVLVFDAREGQILNPLPIGVVSGWQPPAVDVVDTNTDAALALAQARVNALLNGPTEQHAANPVDTEAEGSHLANLPGTEDELTLAADESVTLAAEDEGDGEDTSEGGSEEMASEPPEEFTVTILEEGVPTIDGRIFAPDSVTWRDPPMPLMFTTENTGEGHKGSKLGGTISRIFRDGAKIKGAGYFARNEDGQQLKALISPGPNGEPPTLNGFSADVGGALSEMSADENGVSQQQITQGRIMGGTVLPFQAFDDTRIAVVSSLSANLLNGEVAVPQEEIQEPLKESNDDIEDAQQAAQLQDIAKNLGDLAQAVEEQAQEEMNEDDDDDGAFAARVASLELAVSALADRVYNRTMTFEEERDDHGRWTSGGGDTREEALKTGARESHLQNLNREERVMAQPLDPRHLQPGDKILVHERADGTMKSSVHQVDQVENKPSSDPDYPWGRVNITSHDVATGEPRTSSAEYSNVRGGAPMDPVDFVTQHVGGPAS